MSADEYKFKAILAQIYNKAWIDKEFLAALKNDPRSILNSFGLHPPPNLNITIHSDTSRLKHIVAKPEWVKHGSDFINMLKTSPKDALSSIGVAVDPNCEYKVLYNMNNAMNIIVPLKPSQFDSSIERIR